MVSSGFGRGLFGWWLSGLLGGVPRGVGKRCSTTEDPNNCRKDSCPRRAEQDPNGRPVLVLGERPPNLHPRRYLRLLVRPGVGSTQETTR